MCLLFGIKGRLPSPDELSAVRLRLNLNGLWKTTILPVVDGLTIGIACPSSMQDMSGAHTDEHTFVAIAGNPNINGTRIAAEEVAQLYRTRQMQRLHSAEGSYAIVVYDRMAQNISVFTDALRTTPLNYLDSHSLFAFGPDATTVLLLSALKPKLSREDALLFLLNRYLLGKRTLFSDVYRLCPGELIRYRVAEDRLESIKYWDLVFESNITRSDKSSEALYESLLYSHRSMAAELAPHERYRLFLTGGLDSKGTLAMMDFLERKPEKVLTWGRCGDLPGSDPEIAGRLASAFNVPYEFCAVNGEEWVSHARSWVRLGELQTDNANSYATPLDFFTRDLESATKFYVLGDEMFGAGPIPLDVKSAKTNIFRTALLSPDGILSQVLKPNSCREAVERFETDIRELIERGPNSNPKDVQDYLYFHAYIACWILAPGNFKLPVVPVRRPMLTMPVINCVRSLSPSLRVDKLAYRAMLKERIPKVEKFPATTTDSGVNWGSLLHSSMPLRNTIQQLIQPERLAQLPIVDDLDQERIRQFYQSIFESTTHSQRRFGRLKKQIYNLRSLSGKSKIIAALAPRIQPLIMRLLGETKSEQNVQKHQIAMRLALLVLLHEETCN